MTLRAGVGTSAVPVVATALAAVLLTGVGTVVVRSGEAPAAVTSSPSPSVSPGPLGVDDLEGRCLDPAGFTRVDDARSRLGTLDAAAFAARFSVSAKQTTQVLAGLDALGFETARGHLWTRTGAVYGCVVVRTATTSGATRLLRSTRDQISDPFVSATVPGALTYVEEVDGSSVQHALFVRDRFVYELTLTTEEQELDHAVLDRLLQLQRDHAEVSDP